MRARFTQSFKIQAVEKALGRTEGTSLQAIAEALGVGYSTLEKWIRQSRDQELETAMNIDTMSSGLMTKEKRPQDWSRQEKLNMVISCGSQGEQEISQLCREKGLYPHHINQWKADFLKGTQDPKTKSQCEVKTLRNENKALKKELNRKDKALAETAALLVLQKKVNQIWGSGEDDSQ